MFAKLHQRAQQLKEDSIALYLAGRDPRTPWYAKLLAAAIIGYVLSPIDLIPDFIPILGYVDDLILVPLAIAWAVKMIPPDVLRECRLQARQSRPSSKAAQRVVTLAILAVWSGLILLCLVRLGRMAP
jgi:uncharacterized membrane protein YkvA (DUF1232 family)